MKNRRYYAKHIALSPLYLLGVLGAFAVMIPMLILCFPLIAALLFPELGLLLAFPVGLIYPPWGRRLHAASEQGMENIGDAMDWLFERTIGRYFDFVERAL